MIRALSIATVLAAAFALPAMAQDIKPKTNQDGSTASTTSVQPSGAALSLSEDEGKMWINKPVYSSDGKDLGNVVDFQRDGDNKVIGMRADIGGFMGLGETRIALTAAQFKLQGDRVMLELTAEQAKTLPNPQK
jgi:PRC-barrel domain protein